MRNFIPSRSWQYIAKVIVALSLLPIPVQVHASQFYLEDADLTPPPSPSNPNTPDTSADLWPRIMMAETQTLSGNPEQYSKYGSIASSAGTINRIGPIQSISPNLLYFRTINPTSYLGFNQETPQNACPQGHGNPFSMTSATTEGCSVYAGHWLYEAGSLSTNSISSASTSIRVDDISRFSSGDYAVIYDAPAGSFDNAEHVRITGKNNSTGTLTIQRGYKSVALAHPSGSIVAQHLRGIGNSDPRSWEYNLSTESPRDANDRTYGQALPIWMQQNYNRDLEGDLSDADVTGFLFDADFDTIFTDRNADVNNDLVVDSGYSAAGVNWWGNGMKQFYSRVRDRFPEFILIGGTHGTRGFDDLNGIQIEGFPNKSDYFSPDPESQYTHLSSQISRYSFHVKRKATGPTHTHVLTKTPSELYPGNANPPPNNNRAFRFAFGLTLLEDGYFAFRNSSAHPDMWFDEYAVNVIPDTPDYGHAIESNTSDESSIRAHTGWLGNPLGPRQRIYSDSEFAPQMSLLSGSFDSNISGWEGRQVNISRVTSNTQDGAGALRASTHVGGYQPKIGGATIVSPKVNIVNGRDYTLVFSARAAELREITASVGDDYTERFLVNENWQRYVMAFKATENNPLAPIKFGVGRENSQVFIDTVEIFEGNANIFRRDFDHGIVVVNATPDSQTISLGGTFKRITGTQDSINNGATLSSVTLAAYDSAILIRRESDQPNFNDTQKPVINITAPVKESNQTISNTTIRVTDNAQILTGGVVVRSSSTAGVSNFNCTQTANTIVDCTLDITSSGNLDLLATDTSGNFRYASEDNYIINDNVVDTLRPTISFDIPTKISDSIIQDTTIVIDDDIGIDKSGIEVREINSTAQTQNLVCDQTSPTKVTCSIEVISSGDFQIVATDLAGNKRYRKAKGYEITLTNNDTTNPYFLVSAPTLFSEFPILDTSITVKDNVGINASQVFVRPYTTAEYSNFSCVQVNPKTVSCTIVITSSGNLKLMAIDLAGNTGYRNMFGYLINDTSFLAPIIDLLIKEEN